MARSRRRNSHASRAVKNNVWTVGFLQEQVLAASAQVEVDIAQSADWAFAPGQRATLLTIRGYLSVTASTDITVEHPDGAILWYIAPIDADVTVPAPPELAGTYIFEDILMTGGHIFGHAMSGGPVRNTYDADINVKTKRTFVSDTDIKFVLANRTSNVIKITCVMRALLRKGGN